ncbi:hypothetical protein [Streptomyces sp. MMS24-I29]|uniref:hypothetical protein n=1 Tax=Streptomyces sp. MMS24-I29 TaxID=3351480 RepID=UPI003C7CC383
MASNRARTLPLAAGTTMPRSVIIRLIAVPSPSGSRLSRCTTVPVRRFGFAVVAPIFFAAAGAAAQPAAAHLLDLGARR